MREQEVGSLISMMRGEQNVSAEKLCKGICTPATFYRLEEQGQIPDIVVLERLLSRLYKSANKIEIMMPYREYEVYVMEEGILHELSQGNYEKAEMLLEEYGNQEEINHPIREQFYRSMKVVLDAAKGAGADKLAEELEDIVHMTLPGFSVSNIEEYLLAEEEWNLVFMWLEQKILANYPETLSECKSVLLYLERLDWDEELFVYIYPKIVWLYVTHKEVDKEEAAELCDKVIRLLTKNGILLFLFNFIELKKDFLKEIKANTIIVKDAEKDYEILKWIYEISQQQYPKLQIQMWEIVRLNNSFLLSETIRFERKNLKKSQEELAWDAGIDQKTLSRIETGRHTPKPGTFNKLKQALMMDRELYATAIAVKDFKLLELKREIAREITLQNFEKTREMLEILQSRLSLENKENRQFLLHMRTICELSTGKIEKYEALISEKKAFEETRTFNPEEFSRITLSENEANIVNYIATIYCELGEFNKAIEILEKVLKGYDASELNEQYHYKIISVVLLKLSLYCTMDGKLEKAMNYCERGLYLQFQCYRSNLLRNFLFQREKIRRQKNNFTETAEFYQNIYCFCKIMNDKEGMRIAQKYLETQKSNAID